jgi:hypothetical protein
MSAKQTSNYTFSILQTLGAFGSFYMILLCLSANENDPYQPTKIIFYNCRINILLINKKVQITHGNPNTKKRNYKQNEFHSTLYQKITIRIYIYMIYISQL